MPVFELVRDIYSDKESYRKLLGEV